eukprot:gene39373-51888_t
MLGGSPATTGASSGGPHSGKYSAEIVTPREDIPEYRSAGLRSRHSDTGPAGDVHSSTAMLCRALGDRGGDCGSERTWRIFMDVDWGSTREGEKGFCGPGDFLRESTTHPPPLDIPASI